jgi:hypothetical protein
MKTDQLYKKEHEIRTILNLYIHTLQSAGKTIADASNNNQQASYALYKELQNVSVDLLSFLDFIDELHLSTSQVRCMVQDWLEIFNKKGIK